MENKRLDFYEFLQISPHADPDTIHRVYRFLAARYHPDNPETGNVEAFSQLRVAYEVLSDPERRAAYDALRVTEPHQTQPLSTTVDFMDSIEGELNRRLAVLAVLYYKRRASPYTPEVPLAEIEARMGFPRDYLDFTTWYLLKKGYITRADNSDFSLTAPGVDFVETQRASIPVLNKLLTSGSQPPSSAHGNGSRHDAAAPRPGQKRLIVLPDMSVIEDRRSPAPDYRGVYLGSDRRGGSAADRRPAPSAEPELEVMHAGHRLHE